MVLPRHVTEAAVVLDEVELLYVPVPKAGSTALLWALLGLAELESEAFNGSTKLEVTRALTIHDTTIWGSAHRLASRSDEDVAALFESADWLTVTVVREPVRRIWSAWVSKILLRDPRFVAAYGGEDWFPDPPLSARQVVASFRRFVDVLADRPEEWHDPHWSSQADLVGSGELDYDVVGRVEEISAVLRVVDTHLRARGRDGLTLPYANPSLVPFVPEVLDLESWERCAVLTASDKGAFGYEHVPRATAEPDASWVAEVEGRIPAILAVIERNERIGDLKQLVRRSRAS